MCHLDPEPEKKNAFFFFFFFCYNEHEVNWWNFLKVTKLNNNSVSILILKFILWRPQLHSVYLYIDNILWLYKNVLKEILKYLEMYRHCVYNMRVSGRGCGNIWGESRWKSYKHALYYSSNISVSLKLVFST